MKLNKLPFLILIFLLIISCSGGGSNTSSTSTVTLASIAVKPLTPSIALGETQQFTATGTYSDSTIKDITTSVTWSSDNTTVATIGTSSGLATAVATGTAKITATSGSISGYTTMTVTPATLSSIAITPANPGMLSGTTKQLTATGTYSDGSQQDLTTSVTWISSQTTIATISSTAGSNGLVTSIAAGTTTITASLGGISGFTLLTVQDDNSDNLLTVTVNGGLAPGGYPNKPCVSVTICSPGTSNCQTIDNILLDTGASGLRIFKSLLTVSLTQATSGSGSLTECIQYSDNSADWGPVQLADIILGNEPAVTVPIQIIDSTFAGSTSCSNGGYTLDSSPTDDGYNGILGVGLFTEDCGSDCTSIANNKMYYSCNGSSCTGIAVSLNNQVQNPVSLLPLDNNGFIVQFLTPVPLGGLSSVNGNLILGIGTRSNNTPPAGITVYPADPTYGEFITVFNGKTYSDSFIDSGSNGLFFNQSSVSALTTCTSGIASGWFCPSSTQSLSATTKGYAGSPSGTVSFNIGNASTLFSSSNNVFIELGGPDTSFDWGLPFFLGRSVYVGIENKTSSLGTGPYWAY